MILRFLKKYNPHKIFSLFDIGNIIDDIDFDDEKSSDMAEAEKSFLELIDGGIADSIVSKKGSREHLRLVKRID